MPSYIGKICSTHPELEGHRRNGNCPQCQREKPRRPKTLEERRRWIEENPETHRATVRKWRDANPDKFLAGKLARNAVRRARKRDATGEDTAETRRAWAVLSRKAKRLGMTIDHIVPIAGCRVCGAKGTHEPSNWQLLTPSDNASKGNRCAGCWVAT
jgi:5-methylcytosine-specific restriction endonuclease McrA